MPTIIKDTLHPENESGTDIYPKTSNDQVVGYGQNLEGKDYALVDETCKKPTNLGTPTHVLGVAGSLSNQPISIPIGYSSDNIPKRNANRNVESLYDAINDNEYVRKSQFDKGLSEVSAPVVTITATSTATQGTISSADLAVLQGNKSAIIRFNNELYYFMDDEFKSGYLTYSHVGVDSGVQWVKSITITISSLSWVLTKAQVGSSGTKLYRHVVTFSYDDNPHTECSILLPRSTKFSSKEEFCNYFLSKGYLPNLNNPAANIGVEMVKMGNTTSASVLRPIGVFCTYGTIVIYYLNVSNISSISIGYLGVDSVIFQNPVEV